MQRLFLIAVGAISLGGCAFEQQLRLKVRAADPVPPDAEGVRLNLVDARTEPQAGGELGDLRNGLGFTAMRLWTGDDVVAWAQNGLERELARVHLRVVLSTGAPALAVRLLTLFCGGARQPPYTVKTTFSVELELDDVRVLGSSYVSEESLGATWMASEERFNQAFSASLAKAARWVAADVRKTLDEPPENAVSTKLSVSEPTFEHRHRGNYAHLSVDPLGLIASTAQPGRSIVGAEAAFSLAFGTALTENLILAAEVWLGSAYLAAMKPDLGEGGSSEQALFDGVSLIYYLMPSNVYLAVTPGFAFNTLVPAGDRFATVGFGGRLAAGKEWWIGPHWGLGVSAESLALLQVSAANPFRWTTFALGLGVSATYN